MRAKLVQGTNSMIWANRVLPTFTAAPRGCQSRETTYYLVVRIQIGTKSNWTQTRANACSRACHGGFNRTAVIAAVIAGQVVLRTADEHRIVQRLDLIKFCRRDA